MKSRNQYWLVILVFSGAVILFFNAGDNDRDTRLKEFNQRYGVYALDLPRVVDFGGELMPSDIQDVRERLDREILVNTYWQSQSILLLKRKERWFPVISKILNANGIPDDFKYLALTESGLTNSVSPSGASGFWQFLEPAALEYGLEVNAEVDERFHVEKSTEAACAYFRKSYEEFGNWALVALSYNIGINAVKKEIDSQQTRDYYKLLLDEEPSRYLFRILAIKEISRDPLRYGFHLRKRDFYLPYNFTVDTVNFQIRDLVKYALSKNISYKELKILNPWLRQSSLTNKDGKSYELKIYKKPNRDLNILEPADTSWIRIFPSREHHQE
jgi:membrane-bound lytic murein transglycosylase D